MLVYLSRKIKKLNIENKNIINDNDNMTATADLDMQKIGRLVVGTEDCGIQFTIGDFKSSVVMTYWGKSLEIVKSEDSPAKHIEATTYAIEKLRRYIINGTVDEELYISSKPALKTGSPSTSTTLRHDRTSDEFLGPEDSPVASTISK